MIVLPDWCSVVLAIDPGKSTGWALLCARRGSAAAGGPLWWLTHAGETDGDKPAWIPQKVAGAVCVVEYPQHRPGDRRSNPNDLIALAYRAGYIAAMSGVPVFRVLPSEWKASVEKSMHQRRILSALTAEETALLVGKPHDTVDAVGLGLWAVGRMKRGGQ